MKARPALHSPPSIAAQRRAEVEEIVRLIGPHMGWGREKILAWLKTDNPMLGGVSPASMITRGRGAKLLSWVRSAVNSD